MARFISADIELAMEKAAEMMREDTEFANPDDRHHVLVTGVTGFIAAALTEKLLQRGYVVHGTIRNGTVARVPIYEKQLSKRLHIFETDLMEPQSFDEATKNCAFAYLLAAPSGHGSRTEDAIAGAQATENVLQSCEKAGVHRVVFMSSISAVMNRRTMTLTETDWPMNEETVPKAHAERTALKFVNSLHQQDVTENENENAKLMEIVSIVAPCVWGKSMRRAPCKVKTILILTARGELPGLLDLSLPAVHIQDVVCALLRAIEIPQASGRYICCSTDPYVHMKDIYECLRETGGLALNMKDYTGRLKMMFLKFVAWIRPTTRPWRNWLRKPAVISNRRIIQDLGVSFTPVTQALTEAVNDLIEKGYHDEDHHFPKLSADINF